MEHRRATNELTRVIERKIHRRTRGPSRSSAHRGNDGRAFVATEFVHLLHSAAVNCHNGGGNSRGTSSARRRGRRVTLQVTSVNNSRARDRYRPRAREGDCHRANGVGEDSRGGVKGVRSGPYRCYQRRAATTHLLGVECGATANFTREARHRNGWREARRWSG